MGGWAGRRIRPTRAHVPLPRRWVWMAFNSGDVRERGEGVGGFDVSHVRLAHTHVRDGRARNGQPLRVPRHEVWEILNTWAPPRGNLWVWTCQPQIAPWALGMHLGAPESWGFERGHTVLGADATTATWKRNKAFVRLATVQAAMPRWDRGDGDEIATMRRDVLAWASAIEQHGLGRLRSTLGAQAWESYRARWCASDMWAGGSARHVEIARESYIGGIAAALRTGYLPGEWNLVDMRRCYRRIMAEEPLPLRSVSYLTKPDIQVLRQAVSRDLVIATVDMLDRGWIAPERGARGQLHWERGPGIATLTTPGLRDALAERLIDRVLAMATWTKGKPLAAAARGVEWLERLHGRDPESVVAGQCKGLANAIVGRLGMRSRRWKHWDRATEPAIRVWSNWNEPEQRYDDYRQIGHDIEHQGEATEHPWGHAAAASHVTAYARSRLRRCIQVAGQTHVAHVDTDGLLVHERGLERLADSPLWEDYGMEIRASGSAEVRGVRDFDCGQVQIRRIRNAS